MAVRVLVVDDNATNLDLMLYLLGALGYDVSGESDGLRGLESAKSGEFALVLCDVLMPGIDGYEFARRLKAEPALRSVPLVAVTALAMPADGERIRAAGFDGYIKKPIEPQTFGAQIRSFLSSGSS
ncbi:MAG: response regulator [Candidatus Eremiobacteraeota bacterium]|nr:response regulator [Candidatus Eremiobacteraeota bacterium]